MRHAVLVILAGVAASPALAQQPFSPLSGPNTAIPSPVCDLINFGFCPQPPGPPAPLPDLAGPPPVRPVAPPRAQRVSHSRHRHFDEAR